MLSFVVVLASMTTLAALKIALRRYLGYLFSDDVEVVAMVASLVSIAALFQISDGLQAVIAGVMRGMGKQHIVAWMNFLGFWVIGV